MNSRQLTSILLQSVITAVIVLFALFAFHKLSPNSLSSAPQKTFEVEGIGKVTVEPDMYMTDFNIQEKGTDQKTAREAANKKQTEAMEALTKLGFDKKDIKTTSFSVNPEYEFRPNGTNVASGYSAWVNTQVKSKDVEMINKAIDSLTELGMNVGGVTSTFEDEEKYKSEARQKAVEQAKKKAQDLANGAGFKLGELASIKEGQTFDYGRPMPMILEKSVDNAIQSAPATEIQPGSNEVTAQVTLTYYIE